MYHNNCCVRYLSELLHTSEQSIDCEMALRKTIEKYSVSDKVNKTYDHRFFKVTGEKLPKDDDFEIAGIKFRWWNISDLEVEPKTVENNSEIVAAVKNEVL